MVLVAPSIFGALGALARSVLLYVTFLLHKLDAALLFSKYVFDPTTTIMKIPMMTITTSSRPFT